MVFYVLTFSAASKRAIDGDCIYLAIFWCRASAIPQIRLHECNSFLSRVFSRQGSRQRVLTRPLVCRKSKRVRKCGAFIEVEFPIGNLACKPWDANEEAPPINRYNSSCSKWYSNRWSSFFFVSMVYHMSS